MTLSNRKCICGWSWRRHHKILRLRFGFQNKFNLGSWWLQIWHQPSSSLHHLTQVISSILQSFQWRFHVEILPPPFCTSVLSPLKPMLELLNIINATTTNLSPLPTCRTLDFNACVREIKWFWTYSNIYMAFDINECCCCCYQNWMFNRYEEPTHVS